ncbi:TolC family protein [Opitutales bacterium]|nr:TolC family protein [Opitutales bacterium]
MRQADRNIDREAVDWYDIKQQKALLARNSWRAVDTGVKQLEVTQRGVELNQEAFEQERARYGAGLVSYRGVLEAQRDFDQARRQNLSAVIESLRAAIRLSRVDGSILERNGFTWETVDALAESPNLTEHPLGEEILETGN